MTCPFCDPEAPRVLFEDRDIRVLRDAYPVSPGHLLIVPRRHIARWSHATTDERHALLAAIDRATARACAEDASVDGFNIGWNDGESAGQTIVPVHGADYAAAISDGALRSRSAA